MMMGFGFLWIIFLIALTAIGISALIVWLISSNRKQDSNKVLRTGLMITILLVLAIGIIFGLLLLTRIFSWNNFGPGWMMGSRFNAWENTTSRLNQTWPCLGMHGLTTRFRRTRQSSFDSLTIEETKDVVQDYLSDYGDDDLIITEIMIFDNHGYAIVSERSSGVGAFELLIDPVAKTVYPEYGPNMMWNLKYGMHSGSGMMGGRTMHDWRSGQQQVRDVEVEMPIDSEEVLLIAQKYLDKNLPGAKVSDHITAFYGYYTIDLEINNEIFGMLSVNGYTGQVFLHTWHGTFIKMSEHP